MIELAALPIAGLCDRIRGGYPEGKRPKWVKYLAMALVGPCVALQVVASEFTGEEALTGVIVIALSLLAAFTTMWRQDNGWRGRWVQGSKAVGRAMQWGAVASIPFLLLAYFDLAFLIALPAFVIGTPLAIFLATLLPATEFLQLRNAWPWSELIELPIIGGLFFIGVNLL